MPNDGFDDDLDFAGSEGMANLRKALDKANKRISDLEAENTAFRSEERKKTVGEALAALGVNAKIAALVPSDLAVDGVAEWAKEYGFIPAPDEGGDGEAGFYSEDEKASLQRIEGATEKSGGTPQDLAAAIAAAQSREELEAILRGQ